MQISHWRGVWRRFRGRGVFPHELAFALRLPGRGLLFSPRDLLERLRLESHHRVLELGPGPGYFSLAVARAVPRGRLVLADVQVEMLRKARRRLRRAGAANAHCAQADAAALPFRPASFDAAFLVAVLGEVPAAGACLAALHGVLRPGGLLAVTELPGDPDALSEAEVAALAAGCGFAREAVHPTRVGGFTLCFRRPPDPPR